MSSINNNNKIVKSFKLNNHSTSDIFSHASLPNVTTHSATSLHVRHSTSKSLSQNDDDEFYDAVDAVDGPSTASSFKNGKSKDNEEDDDVVEEDDDNDRTFVFFDTATSRHASEMSTNESFCNANKLGSVSRTKSITHEENSISDEKIDHNHETKNSTNNNEPTEDEDDQSDAELETAWSFWIDKCVKGASKEDYEASIKLIHTVKTVQVSQRFEICSEELKYKDGFRFD